jgi:hypothetical protein
MLLTQSMGTEGLVVLWACIACLLICVELAALSSASASLYRQVPFTFTSVTKVQVGVWSEFDHTVTISESTFVADATSSNKYSDNDVGTISKRNRI